jgi:hypothetical protein
VAAVVIARVAAIVVTAAVPTAVATAAAAVVVVGRLAKHAVEHFVAGASLRMGCGGRRWVRAVVR